MSQLTLKSYKIREMHFKNRVAANTPIELEQRQSFKVHFIKEKNECIGQCKIEIKAKDKELPFGISMEVEGLFAYKPDMDKSDLQAGVYRELFPYVRVLINSFATGAGIPPLLVLAMDMDAMNKTAAPVSNLKQ